MSSETAAKPSSTTTTDDQVADPTSASTTPISEASADAAVPSKGAPASADGPTESGARQRSRMALKIPDDHVPPAPSTPSGESTSPSEAQPASVTARALESESPVHTAALLVSRIVTINTPPSQSTPPPAPVAPAPRAPSPSVVSSGTSSDHHPAAPPAPPTAPSPTSTSSSSLHAVNPPAAPAPQAPTTPSAEAPKKSPTVPPPPPPRAPSASTVGLQAPRPLSTPPPPPRAPSPSVVGVASSKPDSLRPEAAKHDSEPAPPPTQAPGPVSAKPPPPPPKVGATKQSHPPPPKPPSVPNMQAAPGTQATTDLGWTPGPPQVTRSEPPTGDDIELHEGDVAEVDAAPQPIKPPPPPKAVDRPKPPPPPPARGATASLPTIPDIPIDFSHEAIEPKIPVATHSASLGDLPLTENKHEAAPASSAPVSAPVSSSPASVPKSEPTADTPRVAPPPPPVAATPPPPPAALAAAHPPPPPPAAAHAPPASSPAPSSEVRSEVPQKKKRAWWEELFDDDYMRSLSRPTDTQIGTEVTFVEERLGLAKGATILDLACGTGRHAVELNKRGYHVVGFDLSLAMLSRASDEAEAQNQKINFMHGDMREMAFQALFDGVYCWGMSFGFFDEERNLAVLQKVYRALRPGGVFLLDVFNRDFLAMRQPNLVWFEGDGCICMDETSLDAITSRLKVKRTVMLDSGRTREIEYSIRMYGLHELGRILHECGFKVLEVTGHPAVPGVFFGAESPRCIILSEKAE